ncbi:NAD(P)-binding protein [Mycena crocata]|nr:NAD(P)-binding protein [Mycena crocata]
MSSPKRIVSVFGATGLQGASVISAILQDGTFTPRGVTRDPGSAASLDLAARGVEVVKADLWEKSSLVAALQGSEAVFGITNYFDPSIFRANPAGEIEQGKNLVDAAKVAGVKFFVFSSLPHLGKVSHGKYTNARHYDSKSIVEKYLQSSGLANASIHLGGFLENFWNYHILSKTPTGFTIPVAKFSPASVQEFTWVTRDVGSSVLALIKSYNDGSKQISGKIYPVITAAMTYPALADITSKALGVEVTFTSPPTAGLEEMDDMYACQSEHTLFAATPIPNPELTALGVNFATMNEFMETEMKKRFAVSK